MAQDTRHFNIPSELWFKIIAFVLSDSIYSVCCSTGEGDGDLSWDRKAFGTLRLVSKKFSHTAIKVADLALRRPWTNEPLDDVDGDSERKLKLIYGQFKMINGIHSSQNHGDFFSQNGALTAYYAYFQLMKSCKALFWHSANFGAMATTSQRHVELMEKIHVLFPTSFKNILTMLDVMAVPEIAERLRRDVERDRTFISAGLEIMYRCARVVSQRDEWQSPDTSTMFANYLTDLYIAMKSSAEFYSSALKDRVPGDFPAISELPGAGAAIELIVSHSHHYQALSDLVSSWA